MPIAAARYYYYRTWSNSQLGSTSISSLTDELTYLAKMFMGVASMIEYVFKSTSGAFTEMTRTAGDGLLYSPVLTGATLSTGTIVVGLVFYMLVRGFKKMYSGLMCITMALVLAVSGIGVLMLAFAPPTIPPTPPPLPPVYYYYSSSSSDDQQQQVAAAVSSMISDFLSAAYDNMTAV
jgi:hypothetical protein